jgi:ABC-type transporter Mla subunit MlaD
VKAAADGVALLLEGPEAPVAQTMAKIDKAAAKLEGVLDGFTETGREAADLIASSRPRVVAILDRLKTTGTNLKAASEDLRAHPWKLLNEPSEDEIAYENLRNTMQNYVRAMQHMNATARTLQAILQRGDKESPTVRALIERTLLDFDRSVERYRASESKLVELLQAGEGRPPQPAPSRPR